VFPSCPPILFQTTGRDNRFAKGPLPPTPRHLSDATERPNESAHTGLNPRTGHPVNHNSASQTQDPGSNRVNAALTPCGGAHVSYVYFLRGGSAKPCPLSYGVRFISSSLLCMAQRSRRLPLPRGTPHKWATCPSSE